MTKCSDSWKGMRMITDNSCQMIQCGDEIMIMIKIYMILYVEMYKKNTQRLMDLMFWYWLDIMIKEDD